MDEQDHGFKEQLEGRIATYRDQRERIRARLVELNHDLLDFDRRLDAAEELYQREFGNAAPGADERRRSTALRPSPADQPSWRDAIVGVITARGRPLHVNEIWDALLDSGFQTGSADPIRSIVAIAVRNPQVITRTAPNTYGLVGGNGASQQLSIDGNSAVGQKGEAR